MQWQSRLPHSAVFAAALCCACSVAAQGGYPSKPIRLVTPWPPGGGTDVFARTIAQKLTEGWGTTVFVDNRSGANGNIGAAIVARSPADGYTIMLTTVALIVSQSIYKSVPFDAIRDFAPVTLVASTPFVLVVHPTMPAKSVKELIALAKAKPGVLNYASGGNGGPFQLSAELFKIMAGVNFVQIPYQGAAPAITALLSGQADLAFGNLVAVLPLVNAKRLRALGLTSAKRSRAAPDIPTISEAGLPGYDLSPWFAVWAPAGTPKEIIGKLSKSIVAILNMPAVRERLLNDGADLVGSTPEELGAYMQSENGKLSKVIKQADIRGD
jgi:tripartite-type tricarboxylate transporter receptor subunit TctC